MQNSKINCKKFNLQTHFTGSFIFSMDNNENYLVSTD